MAKKYHPDRFDHDHALKCKAEEKMIRINLAFQVAYQYLEICPIKDRNGIKVETEKNIQKKSSGSTKSRYYAKKCDKEYRQKRDIFVNRFFSWCRNIMGSVNGKEEQSRGKPACSTGNAGHVRSGSNPDFEEQRQSSWKKPTANGHQQSGGTNMQTKKSYKTEPTTFAKELKKSSESLKNIMNDSVKNRENDKISQMKRAYKSKRKPFQSVDTSSKFVKCKKKFLDSYAGPVEKVSPVSRVPKI